MTTVAAMLVARVDDDRTGVLDGDERWTWREAVHEGATRGALARSLFGDAKPHVGVLLPNGSEYLFWLNGTALAGAAIVGINPTRRGEALAADVRATHCAVIVTDDEGAGLLQGLDLGVADENILVLGSERYNALLQRFAGSPEAQDLIENADAIDESALYLLIFTSGTTGVPKAVRCTQGRLAGIAAVAGPGFGYTADDVCYCPMPLFHGNALMGLWGPSVWMGAAIATRPRFSASAFIDDVRRFGATKFSYVGKAIAYILATPERPDDADNTLKSAFGTEASVRDRDRFRKRFGCYLIEGYGASEGGAAINAVIGMPKGALGKPVDGVDLAVMSPETGEECPPAEFDAEGRLLNAGAAIGEIVNRSGRGSFEGYYERPDAEQERLAPGLVLDRRPRLRRRRRLLLLRRPERGLAARRLGELRGRPGRVDHFAPSGPGRGRRLPGPRHRFGRRRSGDGGDRDRARQGVRARGLRHLVGGTARPGPEVAAPLRAGLALAAPDGHGEGHEGRPSGRGLGLRRRRVVASARQFGHPLHPPHRRGPKSPGCRAGRERPPAGGIRDVADCYTCIVRKRHRRSGMAADRVTRFAADLVDAAAVEGARHSRSTKQQLDHWARVGRTVSTHHSTARRRVEAALEGTLALTDLTTEERLVANAESDAAIAERLRTVHYGDVLAAEGVATVALDDEGNLVRYDPDGTTVPLD